MHRELNLNMHNKLEKKLLSFVTQKYMHSLWKHIYTTPTFTEAEEKNARESMSAPQENVLCSQKNWQLNSRDHRYNTPFENTSYLATYYLD